MSGQHLLSICAADTMKPDMVSLKEERHIFFIRKREGVCLPDLAVLQSEDAIQEYQEANQSSRKQHPCIPAEPGEVQTDLLPKISPATAAEHKRTERFISLCINAIK